MPVVLTSDQLLKLNTDNLQQRLSLANLDLCYFLHENPINQKNNTKYIVPNTLWVILLVAIIWQKLLIQNVGKLMITKVSLPPYTYIHIYSHSRFREELGGL